VHVDLTGGTDSGCRPPCEFVGGRGLGESDELVGDVTPLAIVALPDSVERVLCGESGDIRETLEGGDDEEFFHDVTSFGMDPLQLKLRSWE